MPRGFSTATLSPPISSSPRAHAKILGFGLAKLIAGKQDRSVTQTAELDELGT